MVQLNLDSSSIRSSIPHNNGITVLKEDWTLDCHLVQWGSLADDATLMLHCCSGDGLLAGQITSSGKLQYVVSWLYRVSCFCCYCEGTHRESEKSFCASVFLVTLLHLSLSSWAASGGFESSPSGCLRKPDLHKFVSNVGHTQHTLQEEEQKSI